MSVAWEKHFRHRTPLWVVIFISIMAVFIGSMFIFLDWYSFKSGKPSVFVWAGIGAILLGPLLAWGIYHFRTNVDLVCRPDGFSLVKETRKGTTEERHDWSDVTDTHYWESTSRDTNNRPSTSGWYSVKSSTSEIFSMPSSTRKFKDLIQTFNECATNVPHVWKSRTGFNISFMVNNTGVEGGRTQYVKAPRGA